MNLSFASHEVKKHVVVTKINQYFEAANETKIASLFRITLTHIDTGITASSTGYNEVEVMAKCLKKLNEHVVAQQFINNMPFDNITSETEEVNTVIK